ncbi:phosphoribosyltransferase [Streptomyces sp. NPDC004065]|uniref:phosphoribosyltransferase n=1 Tax=Streptomyces sp. NPDC004065 TaxID=3364689 RepID=UPI00384E3BC5
MRYENRADAGRRLVPRLERLRDTDAVVLGVPRGGVPVAFEVARHLGAPLDLAMVRRLRVPWQPELGFGAVGEHGVRVSDPDVVRESGLTAAERQTVERAELAELERQGQRWRAGRAPVPLSGRTAVVLDDGMATGAVAEAACRVARARGAARVVLAVPVAPAAALPRLRTVADEVVCLQPLRHVGSVGAWYEDFTRTTDAQVAALLAEADRSTAACGPGGRLAPPASSPGAAAPDFPVTDREVEVPTGAVPLAARLALPATARAVVAYAHGSGTCRHVPCHQYVAAVLHRAGLGTLLLDLLTEEEEHDPHNVFDIVLLARRLRAAAGWLRRETGLPVSHCGAGTAAAAAVEAAAEDEDVHALVCLAGRPDLAGPAALAREHAPALFVVGALDTRLLGLNRLAADWMRCEHRVAVVPGATGLFTDPGTLETVAGLARDWFVTHPAATAPRLTPA